MLQMKEKATGIRFVNPVLDTMHLSAILHPLTVTTLLDTIAQRLASLLTKRHDALGDAIATGEIFLKMIPIAQRKRYLYAQRRPDRFPTDLLCQAQILRDHPIPKNGDLSVT
jgi:DNA polymerase III alpha subunit (gram-positive type)